MIEGLLLDLFLKPATVVLVALVVAGCLRHRPASARHAIWAAAVVGLLALPAFGAVLPEVRLPIGESSGSRPPSSETLRSRPDPFSFRNLSPVQALPPAAPAPNGSLLWLAGALWAVGALALGGRRMRAELALRRLMDSPVRSERLEQLTSTLAANLAIRRRVRLVVTPWIAIPGTAGFWRPVILLPLQSLDWSTETARTILTHELSHVARADWLTNVLGDLAAIGYWCNPLVMLAVRRLHAESERACDDATIADGTDPHRLADLLLKLAHGAPRPDAHPGAVTALARPRELEIRLLALLDTATPRGPLRSRFATALAGFTFLAALPVAALSLDGSRAVQRVLDPEPDTVSDSVTGPLTERVRPIVAATLLPRALMGPDSLLARRLLEAARIRPRDAADLVPERAAWALGRERDGRLIDPLIEALESRDWRITAYAAWALGVSRDPRAVPALLPHMTHAVWRVRAMTAFALQQMADPRALETMNRALADPAWQVRSEAVRYFAASGGADLSERLRPLLTDRHIAVRLAAEQALAIP